MSKINEVASLCKQLESEWHSSHRNLSKCEKLLTDLKLELTNLIFLPTSNVIASKQELLLARNVLEIGVQWAIEANNISAFERYMAQLKCYYFDYHNQLGESAYKYQLLGLNLLFLLSQNRVAGFHTELELLPAEHIQNDVYIRHPLSIEQYLMEGSYNKIFLAKGNVPAKSYNLFMDILLDTIRGEIATCLETAFEKISPKDAARMLYLQSEDALRALASKRKWKLGKDSFFHFTPEVKKTHEPIPSVELAEQAVEYAKELEMIV
uniref:26S proteasome non-ATPase regulatory subunit 8 n=1 Tax=Dendroctonus ponderosae TaxID=77166 RepID=J3JVB6_DENPD|nr:unknown [Dendroctonus ponderosae]